MAAEKKYTRFWDFYPYYLTEHSDFSNRLLHFIGTAGLLVILVLAILWQKWWMLALIPVCGYGFAWVGHFFIEKNKPATFTYPLYSLGSDFVMFWHMCTGQIGKKLEAAKQTIAGE
ncbi:MAG: DUF962 domain-containing protein [Ferruginibacter sp.]